MLNQNSPLIETDDALANWINSQKDISVIAVDTEFMRVKTYFPKLCLIQLATQHSAVCIDTLKITHFAPLLELLTNPDITKIFHSASQDLETLATTFKIIPTPIFDTQIAEVVLGADHLMSYQDMVESYLNTILEKTETRTNWEKRPLTEKQIDYALEDVTFLLEIYPLIKSRLSAQDEANLAERIDAISDIEHYLPHPENAWVKVKGRKTLKGKRLQLLKQLAHAREELAINANIPKRWMIDDMTLIQLAKHYATTTLEDVQALIKNNAIAMQFYSLINTFKESA